MLSAVTSLPFQIEMSLFCSVIQFSIIWKSFQKPTMMLLLIKLIITNIRYLSKGRTTETWLVCPRSQNPCFQARKHPCITKSHNQKTSITVFWEWVYVKCFCWDNNYSGRVNFSRFWTHLLESHTIDREAKFVCLEINYSLSWVTVLVKCFWCLD